MVLHRLRLHNFRNYHDLTVEFPPGVVLLVGANGQGKTNLLEAVEVASTTRSARGSRAEELVRWGEQQAMVGARFRRNERGPVELTAHLCRQSGPSFAVDGVAAPTVADVMREAAVVSFGPGDLELVRGAPSVRRRMLNIEISKLSPRYCDDLLRYRRALRQRNHLLRQAASGPPSGGPLHSYSVELARYAVALSAARAEYVEGLAALAAETHQTLAGGDEALRVTYRPSFAVGCGEAEPQACDRFVAELRARRARELREGVTLLGPHRDDFEVRIQGKPGRRFGSQGQQRTAAIALRMAQLRLATERLGEAPVLLLDDVLSELDRQRVIGVLELSRSADQVLITATDADVIGGTAIVQDTSLFRVRQGQVQPTC